MDRGSTFLGGGVHPFIMLQYRCYCFNYWKVLSLVYSSSSKRVLPGQGFQWPLNFAHAFYKNYQVPESLSHPYNTRVSFHLLIIRAQAFNVCFMYSTFSCAKAHLLGLSLSPASSSLVSAFSICRAVPLKCTVTSHSLTHMCSL